MTVSLAFWVGQPSNSDSHLFPGPDFEGPAICTFGTLASPLVDQHPDVPLTTEPQVRQLGIEQPDKQSADTEASSRGCRSDVSRQAWPPP